MTARTARFAVLASFVIIACGLAACAPRVTEDRAVLTPARFDDLPGWDRDDPRMALVALARSCDLHLARPADAPVGPHAIAGRESDWEGPCRVLGSMAVRRLDAASARRFIETNFRPYAVSGPDGDDGLFTGYYEASAHGSRRRTARYDVPLYRRPGDLVSADLGVFSDDYRGRSIAGRVRDGHFVPYDDRRAIDAGALAGRGLELLWVDNPVDAFFMQIQGSGRVVMTDGSVVQVGYAGKNGRPYTAIGHVLVEMGAMPQDEVSMQTIRAWLQSHPAEAKTVMEQNRAYVFFREIDGDGPIGSEGVALTPCRSLAVDRHYLPMGVPLYVAANDETGGDAPQPPVHALMVAQDTGGAIRGAVRGDVFLGWGRAAAARAGRMKLTGRYWMLLPRTAAAQVSS